MTMTEIDACDYYLNTLSIYLSIYIYISPPFSPPPLTTPPPPSASSIAYHMGLSDDDARMVETVTTALVNDVVVFLGVVRNQNQQPLPCNDPYLNPTLILSILSS